MLVADEPPLEPLELPGCEARIEEKCPGTPDLVEPGEHGLHGLCGRVRRSDAGLAFVVVPCPRHPGIEDIPEIGVTRRIVGCDLVLVDIDCTEEERRDDSGSILPREAVDENAVISFGVCDGRHRLGDSPRCVLEHADVLGREHRADVIGGKEAALEGPRFVGIVITEERDRDDRDVRVRIVLAGGLVGEAQIDDASDSVVERCLPSSFGQPSHVVGAYDRAMPRAAP